MEQLVDMVTATIEDEEQTKSDSSQQGTGNFHLKILQPKQMLVRLPILLAQVKAGNNSKDLKKEIRQMAYSLLRSKNMSRLTHKNILKSLGSI